MAPIAVGDSLPDGILSYFDSNESLQQVSIHSLAAGKKVILFGVPGAFTPTCRAPCICKTLVQRLWFSSVNWNGFLRSGYFTFCVYVFAHFLFWICLKHVPGFIDLASEFKSKGVDELICLTVNDPFVVKAWAQTFTDNNSVLLLADGSAKYTYALGLELDLSEKGLGIRSRRFALLVDNLVVKVANIEEGGEFSVSSAEDMLKAL